MTDDNRRSDGAAWAACEDEALLLAVAADGDRAAFAELFGRYAGRIKGFLIRAGAPESQAEEAAQEVMVNVWRRAETFDPAKAGAATWIFSIARNKRIDLLRRAARADFDPDDPLLQPETVASAEDGLSGSERDARVRRAIAALSAEQVEVVRLAFFAGLSHAEIAEQMSLPLGTVKSRLRLAFVRLRDDLGQGFTEELHDD